MENIDYKFNIGDMFITKETKKILIIKEQLVTKKYALHESFHYDRVPTYSLIYSDGSEANSIYLGDFDSYLRRRDTLTQIKLEHKIKVGSLIPIKNNEVNNLLVGF